MKNVTKWFGTLLATFMFTNISAQSQQGNSKQILTEVNKEWQAEVNSDAASTSIDKNMAPYEVIRQHLILVEKTLRNRDISNLTDEQRKNREEGLEHLHTYWNLGEFPVNTSLTYRNPVFIDEFNNYCAVGYLIKTSGHDDLARKISEETNYAYLRDIKVDGLSEWANSSGFTTDELAWIQPSYPPVTPFNLMGAGTNGVVYDAVIGMNNNLIIAGSFTEADNQPIKGVAEWISGINGFVWSDIGGGIQGEVKALLSANNMLYAGGTFTKAGNTAAGNIARWDGSTWSTMGNLNGTVNELIVYNGEIYAAGLFSGYANGKQYQNIAKWNGTMWTPVNTNANITINGEVNTMKVVGNNLIIGGKFTQAGGITTNNIVSFDGNAFSALGNGVPARVRAVEIYRDELYAAGDFMQGSDTFGIAKFNDTEWENLLDRFGWLSQIEDQYFSSITLDGPQLLIGGNFHFSPLGGTFSKNLVSFKEENFDGIANLDSTVYTMVNTNDVVYIGGAFTFSNIGWSGTALKVNSITFILSDPAAGIGHPEDNSHNVSIYPNPVTNTATIVLNTPQSQHVKTIKVYDLAGKMVMEMPNINTNQVEISAQSLSRGSYVLNVSDENGFIGSQKFVVN